MGDPTSTAKPSSTFDPKSLQKDLLAVFRRHGLSVAVGLTSKGVMIGSQDERVDVSNIGEVKVFRVP